MPAKARRPEVTAVRRQRRQPATMRASAIQNSGAAMAEITAGMVKELREKTDAPMMECKKALTEANGDMGKAEEILRVKLGNKASKAAARVAAEGVVGIWLAGDGKLGA